MGEGAVQMGKHVVISLSLLLLAGCWGQVPSEEVDRTINAPREAVFDELDHPFNYPAFALVSDSGSSKRYEVKMTEDAHGGVFSRAASGNIFEKYEGGLMSITLEPNSLVTVELVSASGGDRLRYRIRLADDEAGTKTIVKTEVDESDGPLVGERREHMDNLMAMTSSMVGRYAIEGIARKLDGTPVSALDPQDKDRVAQI